MQNYQASTLFQIPKVKERSWEKKESNEPSTPITLKEYGNDRYHWDEEEEEED